MAKVKIVYPDSFEISLQKIDSNIGSICEKAVKAGGEVAYDYVKNNLEAVVGKGENSKSTGELVNSLGVSPAKTDRKGIINVKIGFREPRKKQYEAKKKRSYYTITNAMIANVLEHGKHGQPARPFLARSKRQAKKPCMDAMKNVIDKELKQYT